MIEFLAADPLSLPLWSVLAFSLGFYPLGLILGGECGRCCTCTVCTTGLLPSSLTVTLSNMPEQTPSDYLCIVGVGGCIGTGAVGRVTGPGGDPATDAGPIEGVEVTNPGSGYAKMARVQPTVTTDIEGLSVTLEVEYELCVNGDGTPFVPYWRVSDVTIDEPTGGYTNGQQVTFLIADGDTERHAATAILNTVLSEPTLTATAPGGTGASLTTNVVTTVGNRWRIDSIDVASAGTGYTNGDPITITLDEGDVEDQAAYAVLYTRREEPTLEATVGAPGTGAELSVTLTEQTDAITGQPYWEVSAIDVVNGGTGYAQDQAVLIESGDHTVVFSLIASINVDQNGVIQSVTVSYGGVYFVDTTEIDSVMVFSGGLYYHDDGESSSVTLTYGGEYYREDPEGEPYVSAGTIVINQTPPSNGTGAVLEAVIDDDPISATFGQVTAINVVDAGDDYLAWKWLNSKCCASHYDGKTFVLKQMQDSDYDVFVGTGDRKDRPNCHYEHRFCGVGNLASRSGLLEVIWLGPTVPPLVRLSSETLDGSADVSGSISALCNFVASPESFVNDCGEMSFVAVAPGGQTATVSAGGEYDALFLNPSGNEEAEGDSTFVRSCFICCKGEEDLPEEITVTLTGAAIGGAYDGDYVLSLTASGCPNAPGQDISSYRPCVATWTAPLFPQITAEDQPCSLEVNLKLCSLQGPFSMGFAPLVEFAQDIGESVECDHCHGKCLTEVTFGVSNFFGACLVSSSRVGAIIDGIDTRAYQDCTEICEDTPQCGPKPGAYSIRRSNFGDDELLATITVQ